jgi:hypothetical protein
VSIIVIAMTIVLIVADDRLPITTILVFAILIFVPAVLVDALVFFGPGSDQPQDPLARPRLPASRRRRR